MDTLNLITKRFTLVCTFSFILYVAGVGSIAQKRSLETTSISALTLSSVLEPVATGLSSPIYVTNSGDGGNRLFIVEQGGVIKVLQPGLNTPTVFLDISSKVLSGGERGLLGLAFHPQFSTNRRFFVNYTRTGDGATVISEYNVSASNPNIADTTETVFITILQPFANHNGGMIEFGPDGFLYIGMGDGGSANDPGNRAQNINELLGKILRIDIDTPNGPIPYSSPPDNPFFGATPGRDEIYATGFRNPWRFSFDRETGQLYAGDVGQGAREEIDIVTLGGNYGWRVFEGTNCTNLDPTLCNPNNFVAPIAEYSHAAGRCSITGGYVYRGGMSTLPAGAYVYADFCTGEILLLQGSTQTLLLDTTHNVSSFGEDESGEIYVVAHGGSVFRIRNQANPQGVDSVGLFNGGPSQFFLRNSNSVGVADITFAYGPGAAGWVPITGDWNGDGTDSIGLYNPSNGGFYLRNSNNTGFADIVLTFGPAGAGWKPLVGDWNGDGIDTIGLYNPANGVFYLRNSNSTGVADLTFLFGPAGQGWVPLVGDWNGDGADTVGLYDPMNGAFFLRNSNATGVADITFSYGPAAQGWVPLAGDWNGDATDTIGLYNPANSVFYLRNTNSFGFADVSFLFGPANAGWTPIVGDWDGL